ncbi:hypothetical protein RI367_002813 [Sorochytrium milnesiophthora]
MFSYVAAAAHSLTHVQHQSCKDAVVPRMLLRQLDLILPTAQFVDGWRLALATHCQYCTVTSAEPFLISEHFLQLLPQYHVNVLSIDGQTDQSVVIQLSNSVLYLTLPKDAYQSLNMTGTVAPEQQRSKNPQRYVVEVPLHAKQFKLDSKRYERVKWCLEHIMQPGFTFAVSISPRDDGADVASAQAALAAAFDAMSISCTKQTAQVGLKTWNNVTPLPPADLQAALQPTVGAETAKAAQGTKRKATPQTQPQLRAGNRTDAHVQECIDDVLEWLGMVAIGAPGVQGQTLDPFISRYAVSADQEPVSYTHVQVKGIFTSAAAERVLRPIWGDDGKQAAIEQPVVAAVILHGIEDVVVKRWRAATQADASKGTVLQTKYMSGEHSVLLAWLAGCSPQQMLVVRTDERSEIVSNARG